MAHVWQVHKMTARDYKEKVLENGTFENLKKGESNNYKRSEQTMKRLKEHWKKVSNLAGRAVTVQKIEIKCAICGKAKMIYPRAYRENNNYCGVVCRNIANNRKRNVKTNMA